MTANKPMLEDEVSQNILLESPKLDTSLLRNNSGAFTDNTGRTVRFGLGNLSPKQTFKSSDYIGITTITITPDMVGTQIGVFTAVEVKREGWKYKPGVVRELHQKNFIEFVLSKKGFAGFASCVEDFRKIIKK